MNSALQGYAGRLETLAHDHGLDYYPVQFEEVPSSFMMEVAVYGLPVRMPHWSFGVRYIYQLVQHRMGHSRLFEVVFPGNPGRAYLGRQQLAAREHARDWRTCSATRTSRRTTRCSSAARSRWATASSSKRRRTRARSARPSSSTARRESSRCSTPRSRSRRTSIRSSACAASAIPTTSTVRAHRSESGFQKRFDNLPGGAVSADAPLERVARADPAGSRARSPVVHRGVRAGARGVGARHLPRRARGVVLLLSRVRLPDHERGLGVVLARAPVARGGLPAAQRVPRRAEDAFRRRAAARGRAAGLARR